MNVLIDRDEEEPVALTHETDLKAAVTAYLKHINCWDGDFYNDGDRKMTAEQFVNSPRLLREAFELKTGLPVVGQLPENGRPKKFAYLFSTGGRVVWSSETEESLPIRLPEADQQQVIAVNKFILQSKPGEFIQTEDGEFIFNIS